MNDESIRRPVGAVALFRTFAVVGLTAFGLAALQDLRSVPVERGWLDREDVDEGVGLVQLYPGAMMVDLVAYVGYRTGRIRGALAAATGYVTPSVLLMLGLSWAYVEYGATVGVSELVVGLGAIVVGVVAAVMVDFAAQHLTGLLSLALAVGAIVLGALGVNLLWVVLGALVVGGLFMRPDSATRPPILPSSVSRRRLALAFVPAAVVVAGVCVAALAPGTLGELTVAMARVGAVAFGNGYTMLPVLQQEVVDTRHWLDLSAFGAGIAFGQMTPGPILITAVFVGFAVAGWWGGVLAAVAIFAPSVAMTVVAAEVYPRVRELGAVRGAVRAVMATFVGLLVTVIVSLGRQVVDVPVSLALAVVAFAAVRLLKLNLLVVFGAGLGLWSIYLSVSGPLHG